LTVATLARLHPGRLRIGLGHGVQSWDGTSATVIASPIVDNWPTGISACVADTIRVASVDDLET